MRAAATIVVLSLLAPLGFAAKNLTVEDRIELVRGLMAEYATAKGTLPRAKRPLEFNSDGTFDLAAWQKAAHNYGPAARAGDRVQITKVTIESDRIVFQINGGFNGGRHWYQGVQVEGPVSTDAPIGGYGDANAPGGTNIALVFHKPLESITAAQVKKMLTPVLDFDKRTATQLYAESLPPAVQKAIKEKRVVEGMNHDQVLLAMGHPAHKSREEKDGMELEDWVYGTPPGKITFVTFNGDKVIKVKVDYAGLGTEVK